MMLDVLAAQSRVEGLEPKAALVVRTIRVWAGLKAARRCPMAMALDRLGSVEAANGLRLLVVMMSAAWPDPIALAPPCCPVLSHDEALIGALFDAAATGDRPGFDTEARDMLDADARCRLWCGMRNLAAAIHLPAA